MKLSIEDRIEKGVKFLNKNYPNWLNQIPKNLKKLDMNKSRIHPADKNCGCIGAFLFRTTGTYYDFEKKHFKNIQKKAADYGFINYFVDIDNWSKARSNEINKLTISWREKIKELRKNVKTKKITT